MLEIKPRVSRLLGEPCPNCATTSAPVQQILHMCSLCHQKTDFSSPSGKYYGKPPVLRYGDVSTHCLQLKTPTLQAFMAPALPPPPPPPLPPQQLSKQDLVAVIINRVLGKVGCVTGVCSKTGPRKEAWWCQLACPCHLVNWVPETRAAYSEMSNCQKSYLVVCQLSLSDSTTSIPSCRLVPSWAAMDNTVPDVTQEQVSDPHLPLSSRFCKNLSMQGHDFISQTSSLYSV